MATKETHFWVCRECLFGETQTIYHGDQWPPCSNCGGLVAFLWQDLADNRINFGNLLDRIVDEHIELLVAKPHRLARLEALLNER